jgi:hypothetical protein
MRSRYLYIMVAILVVCAGTISCNLLSPFGISNDTPLGKIDKYEGYFAKQGIQREGIANKGQNIVGVGTPYLYTMKVLESEMGKPISFDSKLVVTVDDKGTVLAINTISSGQPRDRIRIFMKELWTKLSGMAPDFSEVIRPPQGYSGQAHYGNKFEKKGVAGVWEQQSVQLEFIKIVLADYASGALK